MTKKDVLIILIGVAILVIIILLSIFIPRNVESVNILTDNENYDIGDILKVKIENNTENNICFSACYPYYFEKKESTWNNYRYQKCLKDDIIENCVSPNEVKAFEIKIPLLEKGVHRIVIPLCVQCNTDNPFNENDRFYSNEFIIK